MKMFNSFKRVNFIIIRTILVFFYFLYRLILNYFIWWFRTAEFLITILLEMYEIKMLMIPIVYRHTGLVYILFHLSIAAWFFLFIEFIKILIYIDLLLNNFLLKIYFLSFIPFILYSLKDKIKIIYFYFKRRY